jgi:hypothetical protein
MRKLACKVNRCRGNKKQELGCGGYVNKSGANRLENGIMREETEGR